MYVRVKNRGLQPAQNVRVDACHALPGSGLAFPDGWAPMDTPTLSAPGPLAPGASVILGPFRLVPTDVGHECLMAIAHATGDPGNDTTIQGTIPEHRFVPFDNNIGQRNVSPVRRRSSTSSGCSAGTSSGSATRSESRSRCASRSRCRNSCKSWAGGSPSARPLPGFGAGLIIVGAHMDSTAGFEPGYSAPASPAPSRDDNGSGLAGVLSLARLFRAHAGRLTHTVRLCFFNAWESGLVGSKAYAASLKAAKAPVRAVLGMEMIGYNSDANRIFKLHAGYADPAVRDLGLPLADRVALAAAQLGHLARARGSTRAPRPSADRNTRSMTGRSTVRITRTSTSMAGARCWPAGISS